MVHRIAKTLIYFNWYVRSALDLYHRVRILWPLRGLVASALTAPGVRAAGGGGERASADKDGGAVPLDVQSLDLDEKVPQWSAKQKSSKSNAVKYVVRGNEDGDDDSDDGDAGGGGGYTELKSSGKAGASPLPTPLDATLCGHHLHHTFSDTNSQW